MCKFSNYFNEDVEAKKTHNYVCNFTLIIFLYSQNKIPENGIQNLLTSPCKYLLKNKFSTSDSVAIINNM